MLSKNLLAATEIAPESRLLPLRTEAEELTRILGSIIVKARGIKK